MSTHSLRKKGRPRNPNIEERVLDSVMMLLSEASMEMPSLAKIAALSNISRPTLYRRWSNLADIYIWALLEKSQTIKVEATGDPKQDTNTFITMLFTEISQNLHLLLKAVLAEAIKDEDYAMRLHNVFKKWRKNHFFVLLEDTSEEEKQRSWDLVMGIIWQRLIFHQGRLDDKLAQFLTAKLVSKTV